MLLQVVVTSMQITYSYINAATFASVVAAAAHNAAAVTVTAVLPPLPLPLRIKLLLLLYHRHCC